MPTQEKIAFLKLQSQNYGVNISYMTLPKNKDNGTQLLPFVDILKSIGVACIGEGATYCRQPLSGGFVVTYVAGENFATLRIKQDGECSLDVQREMERTTEYVYGEEVSCDNNLRIEGFVKERVLPEVGVKPCWNCWSKT